MVVGFRGEVMPENPASLLAGRSGSAGVIGEGLRLGLLLGEERDALPPPQNFSALLGSGAALQKNQLAVEKLADGNLGGNRDSRGGGGGAHVVKRITYIQNFKKKLHFIYMVCF
jgi:hypothetical protein